MSPTEVIARAIDPSGFDRPADYEPWAAGRRQSAYDRARKYLAALNAAGLAVVPVEPTRQMIHALRGYAQCAGYTPKTYRAMVAVEQATKEGE